MANRSDATVVAFSPAQQATGGTLTPAVTLSDDGGGSIAEPQGIAFDETGNLWVANFDDTTVVRFSPSQLAASGTPTPTATIAAATFSSTRPNSVAIDHDGSLWVTVRDNGTLNKIENAAALSGTVTPTVTVEIWIGSFDTGFPTFWPTPPGVPIRAP